jgi:hypothetical protein
MRRKGLWRWEEEVGESEEVYDDFVMEGYLGKGRGDDRIG